MILHITLPEDWAAARRTGRYTASTRGASIDDVGFLHASDAVSYTHLTLPTILRV